MGDTENLENVGYLQDIISYIFDEKKIVSYKWISNTLAIHVNRAKQLLYTFIKHISKERLKQLKVTYLVGGILPDDRAHCFQVVSEEDLEKVKSHFKVITSEHIYSVSLDSCLVDLHNLYSVDGAKDSKVGSHGALRCTKSIARSAQDMAAKRKGAFTTVDDEKKWPAAQPKQQEKQSSAGEKKSSKTVGSISSMFSAQNNKGKAEDIADKQKTEDAPKAKTSSPKKAVPATKNTSKGGNPPANRLAAMFSAQNAKPKPVKNDTIKEETKIKQEASKEEEKVQNDEKPTRKNETVKKNIQEKSSKNKVSKSDVKKSKQKKRKGSDNTEDKNKKRKRIVVMDDSDSSSDDIFGSDDEDVEICPSPNPLLNDEEVEPMVVEKPVETEENTNSEKHRGRKRRLVDKTYEDEEGYIVTKKEYEFVSCSESENEEKENEETVESKKDKKEIEHPVKTDTSTKKPQKNNTQKKNSPEKKKQATLMNFFKRS